MSDSNPMQPCENCGRTIGRLEQKHAWQAHVVCAECYARLSAPPVAAVPPVVAPMSTPVPPALTPPVAPPMVASPHAAESHVVPLEIHVFEGHPSLLSSLGFLTLATLAVIGGIVLVFFGLGASQILLFSGIGLIVLGAVMWLVKYFQHRFVYYKLSNQRLFITTGILSKRTVEIELFRVRDLSVEQTLMQRIFGIGAIHAVSTDTDVPELHFHGIRGPLKVKEMLRQHIMESRQRTRTRDLDIADLPGGTM